MARLQDFQTVTPTASDKLLVVQSQGQGLTTIGDFKSDKMDKANPTGTGSLSLNRKSGTSTGTNSTTLGLDCTASGGYSYAEGVRTVASGARSHAEGTETTSSGNWSHAEGENSTASGTASHCEGTRTEASGGYSHAEGVDTVASGARSHAQGTGSIAQRKSQHVFGEYNIADTIGADGTVRGSYVEIVGKGTADNARSNARTLDWQGNEVLAGDLTINGNVSVANSLSSKKNITVVQLDGDCGNVSANSGGYLELPITIPTGYKTIGICSTFLKHIGTAYPMLLNAEIQHNKTGSNEKVYVNYYSPVALTQAYTDFYVYVLCVEV